MTDSPSPVERLRPLIERMRQREAKFVWHYGCSSAAPPDSEIKRWTDELESILELLLSAPSSAWQPVETAPKDKYCLVANGGTGTEPRFIAIAICAGAWWEVGVPGMKGLGGDEIMPTHWMPLPEPPKV